VYLGTSMTMRDKVRAVQDSPALPDLCRTGSNISSRAFGLSARGLDEEWPVEQDHDQQQDGGLNGCEKGGRILLRQAMRGGGWRTKRHVRPRPLLRPILVQATGPRFNHHVRPRKQGHLISTRILRGTLCGQLATRNFLEDRWVINAPTKGPVLRGGEKSVHEITLDRGRQRRNRRTPAKLGWRRCAQSTPALPRSIDICKNNIRVVIDGFNRRCERLFDFAIGRRGLNEITSDTQSSRRS
jgi:hypothetical protein